MSAGSTERLWLVLSEIERWGERLPTGTYEMTEGVPARAHVCLGGPGRRAS